MLTTLPALHERTLLPRVVSSLNLAGLHVYPVSVNDLEARGVIDWVGGLEKAAKVLHVLDVALLTVLADALEADVGRSSGPVVVTAVAGRA